MYNAIEKEILYGIGFTGVIIWCHILISHLIYPHNKYLRYWVHTCNFRIPGVAVPGRNCHCMFQMHYRVQSSVVQNLYILSRVHMCCVQICWISTHYMWASSLMKVLCYTMHGRVVEIYGNSFYRDCHRYLWGNSCQTMVTFCGWHEPLFISA